MLAVKQMMCIYIGAIQVLRNADGGGGCLIFWKKALRRCNVQCYLISVTRGWVGVQFPEK